MNETKKGWKTMRFIKVRKDNKTRDRGFIAVDAICAAFENCETGKTEIMTMDGFWYEVTEGIEELYDKASELQDGNPNHSEKVDLIRTKRLSSPAVSEDGFRKSHEEVRKTQKMSFAYPKKGYGTKRKTVGGRKNDLPSGDGEGRFSARTKSEDSTPNESESV